MTEASLSEGMAVGRYEVRSLLGVGGMGEVYLAWDRVLERPVALKILPRELTRDRQRVQRFLNEARAASGLSHPAIVTVYETGEAVLEQSEGETVHFIAMERVEGSTLAEVLRRDPSLSSIMAQLAEVAEGLGKAHTRGIVHRDLKPGNIMVTPEGHAKILDFGVAKLIELEPGASGRSDFPTITSDCSRPGTVGYMAPEQIEGLPLDHRSDVFSLGCIIYEAVAGRAPFRGETHVEILHRAVHSEPEPLQIPDPRLRQAVQRIVDRCLAKDREQRYDSARDLGRDLLEAANLAWAARPQSPLRRMTSSRPFRAVSMLVLAMCAAAVLRSPAGALVDAVTAAVRPSPNSEVLRLERLLNAEREENRSTTVALTEREREIARLNGQMEVLRAAREDGDRMRADVEASYRKLLSDVNAGLRGNAAENGQLKERVASAEAELATFRRSAERRSAAQRRLEVLQRSLSPLVDARLDPRGLVLTIPGQYFEYGRSSVSPAANELLLRIGRDLAGAGDVAVAVEGHTDNTGSTLGNLELSQGRAESVRTMLVTAGLDPTHVTSIGRGEIFPAFSNGTAEGRAGNRRVEIIVSGIAELQEAAGGFKSR